ncbi:helix-turn-helix transcriptional regulator [Microbacterium sp. P05]|uniref:helix-turn-helix transcriptional regulator n=1 Tax=Microbacterium sp. P05 TaxID=3366948 RepID=UPI0037470F43
MTTAEGGPEAVVIAGALDDIATIEVQDARILAHGPGWAAETPSAGVTVIAPVVWLTLAERVILAAGPIDAHNGTGAVLAALLPHLADAGTAVEQRRLAVIVRDLLSAIAVERSDADEGQVAPEHRVVACAMQVVYGRMQDPGLTGAQIAGRLGVSMRTLQAGFHASGISLSARIRALRLERARIDLESGPATASRWSAVGTQWGFRNRAHFVRAWQREYGVAPEAFRLDLVNN